MKVAVLSTRLAGLDGVSLETQKMVDYFRKKGDEVVFCAGELDENFPGLLIPEMHFEDAVAKRLGARAFSPEEDPTLIADIEARATEIEAPLQTWVAKERPDLLVVQNCLAIPMQLPLAAALRRLIDSTGVRVLSHEHDFYFERERFATCCIPEFLEAHFPLDRPSIRHLTINTAAREQLLARRGIDSAVLPNVFRFEDPPPDTWPDAARVAAVRAALGVAASTRIILQPTRVVPRKGIELAVELVARVARSGTAGAGDVCLLISHPAGDEGDEYLSRVRALAAERIAPSRCEALRALGSAGRRGRGAGSSDTFFVHVPQLRVRRVIKLGLFAAARLPPRRLLQAAARRKEAHGFALDGELFVGQGGRIAPGHAPWRWCSQAARASPSSSCFYPGRGEAHLHTSTPR
eukprot:gnl/Chilomastix_cuspidata/2494.p2 GENE.gnl/Chilomastix_cuspidata/2494~~gnl/Chilomastix_cuspidata/2494.p2  ORF type:complete len:407 (-),score=114.73 gnl/Chilomastix_cuspidata/2494:2127-3347(-)